MDSGRFNSGVILRVIIILLLAIVTAFVLIEKDWFFTPLVSGILLIIAVIELLRYLNFYAVSLNNFLISVRQRGFNASFPVKEGKGNELFRTFNKIIETFQELSLEKERQYQFLSTLTESIETGIVVFDDNEHIEWLNPEAKRLLSKPGITSLEKLGQYQSDLSATIRTLRPGKKQISKLKKGEDQIEVSVQVSIIDIAGERKNVVLIQNIHREMEIKEIEAWQKLTRVMRHEIMNSMTPIVNLTEAVNKVLSSKNSLEESDEDLQDIKESLLSVENRGKGLLKFVNAYKHFSTIPDLTIANFKAREMIDRIKALLDPTLEKNKIRIEQDIKPDNLEIRADEKLLEQVLINILKNSIEAFGEDGGEIEIFCRQDEDHVLMRISDNGKGIESEVLEKIFIPFFTTKPEGSGIGLSLSRQIIQKHGGTINIWSQPDKGTTLTMTI